MLKIFRRFVLILPIIFFTLNMSNANAKTPTPIIFWHSMAGSLGDSLNDIVQEFNKSQSDYQVVPVYKGDYSETLTATVAAFRAQQQPDIVQIFEVGSATLLNPSGMVVPITQLAQTTQTTIDANDIIPAIRYYYSDDNGKLLALPFNSSSPVMFYNKEAFTKAGLDPNQPPKTWQEMGDDGKKLLKAGYSCAFTSGWPAWIQVESFSAWHNLPFATANNGFSSLDANLQFNNAAVVKHIAELAQWQKERIFLYAGREDEAMPLFTSGQCAMLMESSGAVPDLVRYSKFPVGVTAIPYSSDIKAAPQNTVVGGAALWVLSGHSADINKGAAAFLAFWLKPEIQMQWAKATGYIPITQTAYKDLEKSGYYQTNPGAQVAIKELLNQKPTAFSHGFRLGNYMAIRDIISQQLEAVWSGNASAQQAMDAAVTQGDVLLRQFQQSVAR